MAGADVLQKPILDDLEVPASWKLAHVKGNTCFYWTAKGSSSYRAECVVCKHQFNGVNVAKLEAHLSESQFEEVLGMGRTQFYTMSKVEQMRIKQDVGLF